MQAGVGLLDTDVMPIFVIISLDIIIIMRFSINCSAVICSPTVIHAISREATNETYGPQVTFVLYYVSSIYIASHLLFCNLYFPIYTTKIPKIFTLLSLSNLTFASSYRFVQVRGIWAWAPTGLIPWFSKTEGNTYATLLHHPFLFGENQRELKT